MGPNLHRRQPQLLPTNRLPPFSPRCKNPTPQIYSTARPVYGFDLNLQHRILALEKRAAAEPNHLLVRVQGTIVLSRVALPATVRAEMEAILAPTEILFVTWRQRLGRIDVVRRRGKGRGVVRVEMVQGDPTGIPLIRERVKFHILRRDTKELVAPVREEMSGSTMVWHLRCKEGLEGQDLCVQVVSNSQVLAELDVQEAEGESEDEEQVEEGVREPEPEVVIRKPRRPSRISVRRSEIGRMQQYQQRRMAAA